VSKEHLELDVQKNVIALLAVVIRPPVVAPNEDAQPDGLAKTAKDHVSLELGDWTVKRSVANVSMTNRVIVRVSFKNQKFSSKF